MYDNVPTGLQEYNRVFSVAVESFLCCRTLILGPDPRQLIALTSVSRHRHGGGGALSSTCVDFKFPITPRT